MHIHHFCWCLCLCTFVSALVFAHSNSFCLHIHLRGEVQTLEKLVTPKQCHWSYSHLTDQIRLYICTLPFSHILTSAVLWNCTSVWRIISFIISISRLRERRRCHTLNHPPNIITTTIIISEHCNACQQSSALNCVLCTVHCSCSLTTGHRLNRCTLL